MDDLVDTWYGWIVVFVSAFIVGSEGGLFKSTGQIYIAMLESTPFSRTQLATTCLIPRTVSAFFGVVGNKLSENYSYRVSLCSGILLVTLGLALSLLVTHNLMLFNITYGVITGVGCGLSMTPAMIVSGFYFKKYRSLAIGVNTALAGVNSTYMPLLIQSLLDNYYLDGALLLCSGIFMHGCVGAMLIRHPIWALKKTSESTSVFETRQFAENEHKDSIHKCSSKQKSFISTIVNKIFKDLNVLKSFTANLLLLNRIVIFSGLTSVYLIFPPFAIEQGENITKTDVALCLSVMGIGDVISRIASGIVVNIFPRWKKAFYFSVLILLAFVSFVFQYAHSYGTLLTFSLLYGIISGCAYTSYFVVVFNYFPVDQVPTINALHYSLNGFFTLSLGSLMAELRNVTGSYNLCWSFIGYAILLSAITSLTHNTFFKKSKVD